MNISLHGEPVKLKRHNTYYLIDAGYLQEIGRNIGEVSVDNMDDDIKRKIFPYTDFPYAKLYVENEAFAVDSIEATDEDNFDGPAQLCFATDAALVLLIAENIFFELSKTFDYYKLIESEDDLINYDYWSAFISLYELYDVALIQAPGVNSGYDFEGSGFYRIVL